MTERTNSAANGLLLSGLDGSNPLGFLSALGLLGTLDASARMKWVPAAGTWVPSLSCSKGDTPSEKSLLDTLQERLVNDLANHPAHVLEILRSDSDRARRCLFADEREKACVAERTIVDWLSALASDFSSPDAINQLQTARRDYFLGNLADVIQRTTIDHLRRSIFSTWDYADPLERQSLHLDPSEDRRHAHQWNQPSGDPNRKKFGGMLGANRLAIEAICFFVSVPKGDVLQTTAFSGSRSSDTRWTWPIWDVACSLQVVRSLLTLPALQMEQLDESTRTALREWGIAAVFRTNRILVNKTPNFTPARRVA